MTISMRRSSDRGRGVSVIDPTDMPEVILLLSLTPSHVAGSTAAPQDRYFTLKPLVREFCAHLSQREGRGFKSRQLH
jgi:hypothetical protein